MTIRSLFSAFLLLIALSTGLTQANRVGSYLLEAMLTLGALVLTAGFVGLRTPVGRVGAIDRRIAWGVLLFGLGMSVLAPLMRLENGLERNFALLLILLGGVLFLEGRQRVIRLLWPFTVALLILPFQETLMLALSYPLRLFSTVPAVWFWKIFGVEIDHVATTIYLGESEIAITDACSGITQLWVLLFLGYLLVIQQKRRLLWSVLHYLFLLPTVVVANSLRLILTIGLFLVIGERAFGAFWHSFFGYLLVVLTVGILWGAGFVFPERISQKDSADE